MLPSCCPHTSEAQLRERIWVEKELTHGPPIFTLVACILQHAYESYMTGDCEYSSVGYQSVRSHVAAESAMSIERKAEEDENNAIVW